MKNMQAIKKAQQGFTLIELMIVVAIIGILASVAIPAYNTYVGKSSYSEVIASTSGLKAAVEICGQLNADLNNCGAATDVAAIQAGAAGGLNVASTVVATTGNPVITATAVGASGAPVNGLEGETYVITPTLTSGQVTWALDTGTSTCDDVGYCN